MRNHFVGLQRFMLRWDTPDQGEDTATFVKGKEGRINFEGTADCLWAKAYTPYDRSFQASLEDGVRSLVIALIQELGCITYSSCQGHCASGDDGFTRRHVGIVARDQDEYVRLRIALQCAAAETNRCTRCPFVTVIVREGVITTEGEPIPCLDLVFAEDHGDQEVYFAHLEPVYTTFLETFASRSCRDMLSPLRTGK